MVLGYTPGGRTYLRFFGSCGLRWGDFEQPNGRFDVHDAAILAQALHRVAYCLHSLSTALHSVTTAEGGTLAPAAARAMARAAGRHLQHSVHACDAELNTTAE
ncbi:hypothetical protein GCM10011610_27360 [Nocardia rhizosphaerihabitans]|uniref:Uncharacterized protein n=1 Tax=Nocardia rhizosphaerihabitans TaxID=1691570 RepID=A0ABQ2KCA8_9NOCA|nr:hypothetical protein GCM10011610_27360 [Nocardia rhizosphaerihabitans]